MSYMKNTVGNPRIGDIYEGVVVKVMDFGAFIDFGCAQDGMVHISEVALQRIEDIRKVLSVGDKVKVKFVGFDQKGRAKLSIKRTLPGGEDDVRSGGAERPSRPERSGQQASIGEVYDGVVAKIMDFGAFVDFGFSKDGMVHISEVAPQRVENIRQFLSVGDKVRVKFLGFDQQGRTKLSIKQA
jgi:predicted RNA-binding protein with RPS1 domain